MEDIPLTGELLSVEREKKSTPWRPNMLFLGGMAWTLALTLLFCAFFMVYRLLTGDQGEEVSKLDVGVIVGVATLSITVISGTVAGLLALAAQVSQPEPKDPPAQVPAETVAVILAAQERILTARR